MVRTRSEFYEALRTHIGDAAALVIAEEMRPESELAGKGDIDRLDAKVDAVDAKVDAVDAKVDAVDAKVDAVDAKVDAVDAKVDALRADMDARFRQMRADIRGDILELKADTRQWMLTFFVPLWIGVYGTLGAVVVSILR